VWRKQDAGSEPAWDCGQHPKDSHAGARGRRVGFLLGISTRRREKRMRSTAWLAFVLAALIAGAAWGCETRNPWLEDVNPGHYRGFEWARNNNVGSCPTDGSQSFIEGCLEY